MLVPIILGSKSDSDHAKKVSTVLKQFGIPFKMMIASAHKVPEKVFEIVSDFNKQEDIVYITVAGRSNGLSGVVGANSIHPVIACPHFKCREDYLINIHSTLQMPSDTPTLTVLDQKNAALNAVRILALKDDKLRKKYVKYVQAVKAKFN